MLYILWLSALAACQSTGEFPTNLMLEPGENIHGMTLTKGAADAVPLRAFCSALQQSEHMITAECHIPLSIKLAIGHIFLPTDKAQTELDWSEFTWELSIDDQSLDLDAFGRYDYVMPTLSHSPCPVREVFTKFTTWDVVLTDLKPGTYALHGQAQAETKIYTWIINLIIEPPGKL
jgi:hypothetical protein